MVCYSCQREWFGWRAYVVGVLAWVARVVCYHRWCGCCSSLGCVPVSVVWVGWVACQRGWCEWCSNLSGMLILLLLLLLKYCLEKKNLNVYIWNKNEKMFQIDLNSDLKEEPDLKRRCCFMSFESVMPGSSICLNLLKYAPM